MPVTEAQFSRSQLWPKSNNNWMAPGAVKSTAAAFGQGLDYGALRVQNGIWEIIVSRTPTQSDPRNSEWIPFEPKNPALLFAANGFNRYGPGWSYGPGHNMHSEVITYYQEVNGRPPTQMEQLDIEHNKGAYQALLKAYQDKVGISTGDSGTTGGTGTTGSGTTGTGTTGSGTTGTGTTGSGTGTQPQVPGLPPLSSPEQRAAELLSLLPSVLQQPWMAPLVVEAVKSVRRAEDRIVQRVLAGLKEGNK
jgi:hypothetical protein